MVDDKQEIETLLFRLTMQDRRLTVTAPGLGDRFSTMLLKVDPKRDRLLFDELTPTEGNRLLVPGYDIHFYGWLNGVELDFVTRIERNARGEGMSCFSARLPTAVRYEQRRGHYRIRTHPRAKLRAALRPDGPGRHDADVIDLSMSGVGLLLKGELEFVAQAHCDCLLYLPEEPLRTEVELRFAHQLDYAARTRVGARFLQLESTARAALERYITNFQQELLRELQPRR